MKLIAHPQALEAAAEKQYGLSTTSLMEAAGQALAQAVMQRAQAHGQRDGSIKQTPVLILCGPGNNGGDGRVCAKKLAQAGFSHLDVLELEKTTLENTQLEKAQIIVDALFGVGLNRPLTGQALAWVTALNTNPSRAQQSQQWVIAADLPSGLDSQTGQVWGACVQADETLAFGCGKPGLYLQPGKAYAGCVHVAPIGLPQALIDADSSPVSLLSAQDVRAMLPHRPVVSHKNTFGHVLVVGGSKRMPGAPVLAAQAALSAGAGLVTLAVPETVLGKTPFWPELMPWPLPEASKMHGLGFEAAQTLTDHFNQHPGAFQAILLGPGLGQAPETLAFLQQLLRLLRALPTPVPLVLDADALNLLSQLGKQSQTALHQLLPACTVLTPHLGEAARLLGVPKSSIEADLLDAAKQLLVCVNAGDTVDTGDTTVVLKSASSLVATQAHNTASYAINPTGNNGMATAGSGDVLAGIMAGLLAQGVTGAHAAAAGTYLHGLSGDLAARRHSVYALRASHLLDYLGPAFQHVLAVPEPEIP